MSILIPTSPKKDFFTEMDDVEDSRFYPEKPQPLPVFTGNLSIGFGGKKVPNMKRPESPYDNVSLGTLEAGVPMDEFSRHVDEVLEAAGNKRDSYYDYAFSDTLRPAGSKGHLVTDNNSTGGGVTTSEFINPLFTGVRDSDVNTNGPPPPAPSGGAGQGTPQSSRASPAPSLGASSLSSGINNSNRSSVLDSLAKDVIKPSNVNFHTASFNSGQSDQNTNYNHHNHHRSYKMSDSENSFGGLFDHRGGRLQSENSAIILRIPRGAIPEDQTYAIRGYIHLDLQPFVKHIKWEDGECMISPIPEYHVLDGHHFQRLIYHLHTAEIML